MEGSVVELMKIPQGKRVSEHVIWGVRKRDYPEVWLKPKCQSSLPILESGAGSQKHNIVCVPTDFLRNVGNIPWGSNF